MSYEYSENMLVQENAGNLLEQELGWEVVYAYNIEKPAKMVPLAARVTIKFCCSAIFGRRSKS